MLFEEIIPHLNKISTLYFQDDSRRVGIIFVNSVKKKTDEVYFIRITKGRKMLSAPTAKDLEKFKNVLEKIPLSEIRRIRSSR